MTDPNGFHKNNTSFRRKLRNVQFMQNKIVYKRTHTCMMNTCKLMTMYKPLLLFEFSQNPRFSEEL